MKFLNALVAASFLVLAFSMGTGIAFLCDQNPRSPITDARRNTVLLTMPGGEGSGLLVSHKSSGGLWRTYVWTAAHVILNAGVVEPTIKVRDWQGRPALAVVIAYSVSCDVALLEINQADYATNSVRFYHGAPLAIGTPVFHIGNFNGTAMLDSYSAGFLSSTNWGGRYYQVNCAAYPGSSGGGVFTAGGNCFGLVDKRCETGIALAVSSQLLETWAKTHGLSYALP